MTTAMTSVKAVLSYGTYLRIKEQAVAMKKVIKVCEQEQILVYISQLI
jgi:hypothetical protein